MHKIIICEKCLKIIAQCRCMECNKTIEYVICDDCKEMAKLKECKAVSKIEAELKKVQEKT